MAAAAESGGGGEKTIVLVSSDNSARFEVREAAALLSRTVRRMVDEAGGNAAARDGIPLPNVDAKTLATVLEYCNKHATAAEAAPPAAEGEDLLLSFDLDREGEDLESFDRELVRVDMDTLCSLNSAASYLKIEGLMDLICRTIIDMIKDKTPEQIRQTLGITTSEFTPEVEKKFRSLEFEMRLHRALVSRACDSFSDDN